MRAASGRCRGRATGRETKTRRLAMLGSSGCSALDFALSFLSAGSRSKCFRRLSGARSHRCGRATPPLPVANMSGCGDDGGGCGVKTQSKSKHPFASFVVISTRFSLDFPMCRFDRPIAAVRAKQQQHLQQQQQETRRIRTPTPPKTILPIPINQSTRRPTRWHLLSIDEQASMVSGLEYGGFGEEDGEEESWLQYLFKSQINRPPGSRAKVSQATTITITITVTTTTVKSYDGKREREKYAVPS